MPFLKSTVGRKLIMAITGAFMVLFVVIHLLGNSSVYVGPDGINSYASKLHGLGPFVWIFRMVMLILLSLHVILGIQLTLENNAARPRQYAVRKTLRTTFAGKTMIWTGLLIAAFLIYHLLHFTIQVTNPAISSQMNSDVTGRPDVYRMVVLSFKNSAIVAVYGLAMVGLGLHLSHGIQSFFQTFGLNTDRTMPVVTKGGVLAAIVLFAGYVAIPVIIVLGLLKA
jgi:succinate dehydrogenase / fumarate reductase cytochrome b subunit